MYSILPDYCKTYAPESELIHKDVVTHVPVAHEPRGHSFGLTVTEIMLDSLDRIVTSLCVY